MRSWSARVRKRERLDVTIRQIDALGVQGTVQTVAMRPDMTFRYRFSIQNTGRVPITIVDAGSQQPQDISTKVVSANPAVESSQGSDGFGPFAPFRLAPGQVAALTMHVHVASDVCYLKGTATVWYQEPVTYRVLGITRHAEVPTGTEIRLEVRSDGEEAVLEHERWPVEDRYR